MLRLPFAVIAVLALAGCQDERRCHAEMSNAQVVVNGIDSHSMESLRGAISALEPALAACERAKLGEEHGKLLEAKNQIGAQLALLERKAAKKQGAALTAADLERLQKQGDSGCPKGQAYKHAGLEKEIRCSGPQLVDMPMAAVQAYFDTRHYKLTVTETPPRIRAESGAELFVFTFEKPNDSAGAKCLELYPAPNIPWREAVGRATGVRLDKIKNGGTIPAQRGDLPLMVEDNEKKQLARLGDCGA